MSEMGFGGGMHFLLLYILFGGTIIEEDKATGP
jgi:hypothetical protein